MKPLKRLQGHIAELRERLAQMAPGAETADLERCVAQLRAAYSFSAALEAEIGKRMTALEADVQSRVVEFLGNEESPEDLTEPAAQADEPVQAVTAMVGRL